MKILSKAIITFLSNVVALLAAAYWIKGFSMVPTLQAYATVAAILTLLNLVLRPILKLVLGPLIILTLGIGSIIVNALVLYLLDYLSGDLAIAGLYALAYATLVISLVNFLVSFSVRKMKDEE
jgi:putative membrane protein